MKSISFCLIVLCFVAAGVSAQSVQDEVRRISAQPEKGFSYAYYLFVPKGFHRKDERGRVRRFLVLPNNTGKITDDITVHDDHVKKRIERNAKAAIGLGVVTLSPVFPRPETDGSIYTHALDRDSLTTEKKELARFDQQLTAMIDHARGLLKKEKIKIDEQVLMLGFSASGMFVNRYTFLHPERVRAAVIGSPGGWPIAPLERFGGKDLRYPIGIGDIEKVAGRQIDLDQLREVPMFFFLGDKDVNDSVVYRDGYDEEDENLVFDLFGETPVGRWATANRLYRAAGLNAEFKLYEGVEHTISKEMLADILSFLSKYD